jgi:hypothetical protein
VANCPVGKVTTEVIAAYTTICPVKNTVSADASSSNSLQTVTRSTAGVPQSSSGCNGPRCPGVAIPTQGWTGSHSAYPTAPVTAGASTVTLGLTGLVSMAAVAVMLM